MRKLGRHDATLADVVVDTVQARRVDADDDLTSACLRDGQLLCMEDRGAAKLLDHGRLHDGTGERTRVELSDRCALFAATALFYAEHCRGRIWSILHRSGRGIVDPIHVSEEGDSDEISKGGTAKAA